MQPSERDARIIERILDDADTISKRIAYFNLTKERFCNDFSFEGALAYDSVMNPVYRVAEDALHLSDNVQNACHDVPWNNIRGFRNFVAHGYSEIDRGIAWGVVTKDIPTLAEALRAFHNSK